MTKAGLADKIHNDMFYRNGMTKMESYDLVDMVFDLMKDVIVQEGKLKVAGFGNFEVKAKHTRRGRNPQTGEEMEIVARRVLTFKASQILKQKVSGIVSSEGDIHVEA